MYFVAKNNILTRLILFVEYILEFLCSPAGEWLGC